MPIVGINLRTINAHINENKFTGNIEISSTPKIEEVEKREIIFAGMKEAAVIKFSFKTAYHPDVAEISITGDIIYQTEDIKKLVKSWKDNKKLDEDVTLEIFNAILRRCLTKAISISDDLRLPPPITFPIVTKKSDGKGK